MQESQDEEVMWRNATRSTQTYVDERDGRRWIMKPNYPVEGFYQDLYTRCYEEIVKKVLGHE